MTAAAQAASPPGAFRAALDSVFAGPAYRWADTPYPIRLMREWWSILRDWLAALRADNPAAFRLLVFTGSGAFGLDRLFAKRSAEERKPAAEPVAV